MFNFQFHKIYVYIYIRDIKESSGPDLDWYIDGVGGGGRL